MAISEDKRQSLVKFGLTPEFLDKIEGANKADAQDAIEEGVESKEATLAEGVQDKNVEEPKVEETLDEEKSDEAESGEAEVEDKEAAPEGDKVKDDETEVKELQTVLEKVIKVAGKLSERIDVLEKVVSELREEDETRIVEKARNTPVASLTSMADALESTIVGSPGAKLDGRTALAKAGPDEAESDVAQKTAFPWINKMIAGEK